MDNVKRRENANISTDSLHALYPKVSISMSSPIMIRLIITLSPCVRKLFKEIKRGGE
jgi:hypothetical protein